MALRTPTALPLPMTDAVWRGIATDLGLSPQQQRIVELVLRACRDKEIAKELGLTVPTVRTYLSRVFDRVGVADRLELVLKIFALAQAKQNSESPRSR